jgi:hypothetical protein
MFISHNVIAALSLQWILYTVSLEDVRKEGESFSTLQMFFLVAAKILA